MPVASLCCGQFGRHIGAMRVLQQVGERATQVSARSGANVSGRCRALDRLTVRDGPLVGYGEYTAQA
jgi:hypothetical protein